MREPIVIEPRKAILVACFVVFAILVIVGGWSWPLEVAAAVFPIAAFLIG